MSFPGTDPLNPPLRRAMTVAQGHSVALLFLVVVTAMAISFVPPFSDWIAISANHMWPYPGPDVNFDYFIGAVMGLFCGVAILLMPFPKDIRGTVLFCWVVKLAAALFLLPLYEYAYGLDLDGYFWFDAMPQNSEGDWRSGTWNIRLMAWALFKVIGPSFHGGKVVFAFIGFLGIYLVYRGAINLMKGETPTLFILMSLAPTSLFWSSTLGKDPICLFGIGLYSYGGFHWLRRYRARHFIVILLGALLTSHIRSYFLPIMALPLATAFILNSKRPVVRVLMLPAIAIAAQMSVSLFQRSLHLDSIDSFLRYQAGVSAAWEGGSSFKLPAIDTPAKLALVAPFAAFTALFRPTLIEAHNPFAFAAAIDNTILLVIFLYACARSKLRELFQPELLWMAGFVVMWGVMYGLGTGNMGALSRFKIQALPLFAVLLVYMARVRPSQAPVR